LALLVLLVLWSRGWLIEPEQLKNKLWRQQLCNVQAVKLNGTLNTSPQYDDKGNLLPGANSSSIVQAIQQASKNKDIKAIMRDVDSYGGSGEAAEEIVSALQHSNKPTVALIHDYGTSAAYWSASGAQHIIASQSSSIGDIGVTASYTDNSKSNKQNGVTFNELSVGQYKDTQNPEKPLTAEEKDVIMNSVYNQVDIFIAAVAKNRNLEPEAVTKIAQFSYPVLGEEALQQGLIDQIGGIYEAQNYLKQKIGTEPKICGQ
jgi:protease-4